MIVVNFANADMVGHSRQDSADHQGLSKPWMPAWARSTQAVRQRNGAMLVTADHGNAEQMIDPVTGGPHTAHTTNPVPFIYISEDANQFTLRPDGSLQDISPTVLGVMAIPQPKEMTGHDLRVKKQQ